LALLLGSTFSEPGAVVANVPSGVVWPGFGPGSDPDSPAWTLQGDPVPMMPVDPELVAAAESVEPLVTAPPYDAALSDRAAVRAAEIAVERTRGPILLLSGKDDPVWPSERLAEIAFQRAAREGFGSAIEHLAFDSAGHMCTRHPGLPTPLESRHPVDGALCANGGTVAGNARAQSAAWERTIAFLRASLTT
jgi:pimeloyl-ACP methyl ester carboxylesterase